MKLTVSVFDRGPSCPTDRARCLFFGFVLFVLFIFYFLLVFFSLVPDCTTTQRRFSPAVKYPLFRFSFYLFWVATTVFPVLPMHPSTPEKWSRLRWFFVSDHLITKMPTYQKTFQRPWPRRSLHDHLRQYGRSSQVLEWFLSITQH